MRLPEPIRIPCAAEATVEMAAETRTAGKFVGNDKKLPLYMLKCKKFEKSLQKDVTF